MAKIFIAYLLLLFLLILCSCNPVKQVLKDKNKLDQVAAVVVRSGYCANDTTLVVNVVDTTIDIDTSFIYPCKDSLIKVPQLVTKTIRIIDVKDRIIVDMSRVRQLQADLLRSDSVIISRNAQLADMKNQRNKHRSRFYTSAILLGVLLFIVLFGKTILRAI